MLDLILLRLKLWHTQRAVARSIRGIRCAFNRHGDEDGLWFFRSVCRHCGAKFK